MHITIDVLGMYYQHTVDIPNGSTVYAAMLAAQGVRAKNGGVLISESDTAGNFLSKIEVTYDENSAPTSRQRAPTDPQYVRAQGVYRFQDDISQPPYTVEGGLSFRVTWQYYVVSKDGRTKNADVSGNRRVNSYTTSDTGVGSFELEDGDRVIWRAVAIFGIDELEDQIKSAMPKVFMAPVTGTTLKSKIQQIDRSGQPFE